MTIIFLLGAAFGFSSGVFWTERNAFTGQPIIVTHPNTDKYKHQLADTSTQLTQLSAELERLRNAPPKEVVITATPAPESASRQTTVPTGNFTGEELWQAVNKYRREHGVPELQFHSDLCQLSSRRLGEILDKGSLDNHAGFEKYFDEYGDELNWGLSSIAENLAYGYPTAWETVMGWDSSPPHRMFLLADGSFKYGCTSANRTFSVLIAGY